MRIVICDNKKYVHDIVDIHMKTFTGFFLTFLGEGFLKQLYAGFIEHEESNVIIAFNEDEKVIGFLAYSEQLSAFYKYLITRKLLQFAWFAFCAFLKKPQILFRLLRAFTYSDGSKREEQYVELSSIGVLPEKKNLGVGSKMIEFLKQQFNGSGFDYIKLETDRDDNEGANHFYQKNGFILDHSYKTVEGRAMNEYRLYLGEK